MTRKRRLLSKIKVVKRHAEDNEDGYVYVQTLEDYFALPKRKRVRWGFWYKIPVGLDDKDWEAWPLVISKSFPLQSWLREDIYVYLENFCVAWNNTWHEVKSFFSPEHQIIRKAIPNTWVDISVLIIDVNFAMIKDFYHGEVLESNIQWSLIPSKKFLPWIKKAIKYIEIDRPQLLKEIDEAKPDSIVSKRNYNSLYDKADKLEAKLWKKDTELLKQMIEYRDYFWT